MNSPTKHVPALAAATVAMLFLPARVLHGQCASVPTPDLGITNKLWAWFRATNRVTVAPSQRSEDVV